MEFWTRRAYHLCAPSTETIAQVLEVVEQGGARGAVLSEVVETIWGSNPHARAGGATVLHEIERQAFLTCRGRGRWSRWWLTARGAEFLDQLRPRNAVVR
jgi:hypothetical protein